MKTKINNLVFAGGGILGIAYLGVLDYLYQHNVFQGIERVAGASVGAITACISSFNLPFADLVTIANSLDYSKVPDSNGDGDDELFSSISPSSIKFLNGTFGDLRSVHRLLTRYGWYSTDYIYNWLQEQIATQFDSSKKEPPYTFSDFQNPSIHKDSRPFLDLSLIGTNVSYSISNTFSYNTTPDMEVAEAVRISMSVPLYFESTFINSKEFFCDGGVMRNYPITIFDSLNYKDTQLYKVNYMTLGAHFDDYIRYTPINNFLDYITAILSSFSKVQVNNFLKDPKSMERTIQIDPGKVSFLDFNIKPNDATYQSLYDAGYKASENYFKLNSELTQNLIYFSSND